MSEENMPLAHSYNVPDGFPVDVQMIATLRAVWERFEKEACAGELKAVAEWFDHWTRQRLRETFLDTCTDEE